MRSAPLSRAQARPPARAAKPVRPFERALAAARQGARAGQDDGGAQRCAGRGPSIRGSPGGEAASAGSAPPAAVLAGGAPLAPQATSPPADVAALRAAVRALPPAIAVASIPGGTQLDLCLGGLGVELRAGGQGLEVALQPAAALADAARAELPGLVAALRARGNRVARAEVRPAGGQPGAPGRHTR